MRVRHYERKDRRMTNSTPDTPHTSPTKVAAMKLGELRAHARKLRIEGADELHKPELLAKVKEHHYVSEVSSMKLGELRAHARKLGIDGADELHKPELLAKVKDHRYAQARDGQHREGSGGRSTGGDGVGASAEQDRGGNPTPDTLDVSQRKPAAVKADEQRAHLPPPRNDEADQLHKPEL